jgi:hypothetical protein
LTAAPYFLFPSDRPKKVFGERFANTIVQLVIAGGQLGATPDKLGEVFSLVAELNMRMALAEFYFPVSKSLTGDKLPEETAPHRDHLLHPVVVYLLGRRFLAKTKGTGESEVLGRQFVDHLAELVEKSDLGKALKVVGRGNVGPLPDLLNRAWSLASLCHDIAYVLEPSLDLERVFFERPFFASAWPDLERPPIRARRREAWSGSRLPGDEQRVLDEYFVAPAQHAVSVSGRLDHGQLVAWQLLLRFFGTDWLDDLDDAQRATLFLAMVAVFRHHEWTRETTCSSLARERDPFSMFFGLVDLLAEMRYVWTTRETPSTGADTDEHTQVSVDIWLPFDGIGIERTGGEWSLQFEVPATCEGDFSGLPEEWVRATGSTEYRFARAAGCVEDAVGERKHAQYLKMMTELGFLPVGAQSSSLKVELRKS